MSAPWRAAWITDGHGNSHTGIEIRKEGRRLLYALAIIASGNNYRGTHEEEYAQHVWKLADAILKAENETEET